jgi:hypothetical protein
MNEEDYYEVNKRKGMPNRNKDAELSRYLADEYPNDPSESVLSKGEGKRKSRLRRFLSKMIEETDWEYFDYEF